MRSRKVTTQDSVLHVVEDGDPRNPGILFLHGFPDCHGVWSHQLAALASDFHVIAFDLRGVAESTAPSREDGYRIERILPDIEAVIDATRGPDGKVHLVGHDWGSVLGWSFVGEPRYAARVRSWTSMSGPHVGLMLEGAKRGLLGRDGKRRWQTIAQILGSWYVYALNIPGYGEMFFRLVGAKGWRHALEQGGVPPSDPYLRITDADVLARTRNPIGLYQQNLRPPPAPLAKGSVRTPTLLVVPLRDRFVKPVNFADLGEVCTKLERVELEANHWAQRSHPDVITALVRDFVSRNERLASEAGAARREGGVA